MKISSVGKVILVLLVAVSSFAEEDKNNDYPTPKNSSSYDEDPPAPSQVGIAGAGTQANNENNTDKAIRKLESAEQEFLHPGAQQAKQAVASCKAAAIRARMTCLAGLSTHLQTGAAMVQLLISGMGALSTSQACEKHNSTMKKVQIVLGLYNAACSGFQIACNSTCGNSKANIEAIKAKEQAMAKNPGYTAELARQNLEALQPMESAVQDQIAVCQRYKWNLAAAASGLVSAMVESRKSKACENATTVGGAGSGNGSGDGMGLAAIEPVDCSNAKFSQKPECICMRTPNAVGCPGYSGSSGLAGPSGMGSPTGSNKLDPNAIGNMSLSGSGGGDGNSPAAVKAGAADGGSGAAGSGGGGGGGLGGGGSTASGADASKKTGGSGLNANILSGYDSGGGGGGRGGGGRGGYDPSSSKYKAYLPGGAKDPSRGVASQTFGNGQVTGSGSKSNWEKVSERYKDNKSTLMGN